MKQNNELLKNKLSTCPYCGQVPNVWDSPGRYWKHIQCSSTYKKCPVQPHVCDYWPRAKIAWNMRS